MFNIIKELKTIEKSQVNRLTENQILEAFRQGIVFSNINISDRDYKEVLHTWGFDVKATNQTFFESLEYVENTDEMDLQIAKLVYYTIFEYYLFNDNKLLSFSREGDVENLSETLVKIDVVDDIKPILTRHIETVKTLAYSIEDYISVVDKYNLSMDINKIKSRDLRVAFKKHYNVPLKTVQEVVNSFPGKTRIEKLESMKYVADGIFNPYDLDLNYIANSIKVMPEEQIMSESATYRKELMLLKRLFVSLKEKGLRTKINRCLRKGKLEHTPKVKTFLEKATDNSVSAEEFVKNLRTLTNLQLFRLYSGLKSAKSCSKLFLVKTGRLGENTNRTANNSLLIDVKLQLLEHELRNRFAKHNIKVILPEGVEIALPTSYKNFIGNIPFFSKVDVESEGSIGIIWHDSYDYDLSAITRGKNSVAYWSYTKFGDLVYSGDIRCPGPRGGAEYVSYGNGTNDFNVFVNLFDYFNYDEICTAKVFATNTRGFKVEDKPLFVLPVENFQGQIGSKIDDKLILGGISSYSRNSSAQVKNSEKILDFMKDRSEQVLTLNMLVDIAGWEVIDRDTEVDENDLVYDFSLETLSKDTFIEIFGE